MKIKTVVSAILAISLLSAGGAAFADDHDHGNPHDDRGHGDARDDHRNDHRDHRDDRGDHRDDRGDHRGDRGAGPEHAFHRGDRLPREYRDRQYVVEDWRGHHLSAPPRGYHWVQTGGDYVLVSIGNGVILNFMLGD